MNSVRFIWFDRSTIFNAGLCELLLDMNSKAEIVLASEGSGSFGESDNKDHLDWLAMRIDMPLVSELEVTQRLNSSARLVSVVAVADDNKIESVLLLLPEKPLSFVAMANLNQKIFSDIVTALACGNEASREFSWNFVHFREISSNGQTMQLENVLRPQNQELVLVCQGTSKKKIDEYLTLSESAIESNYSYLSDLLSLGKINCVA